MKSFNEFNAIDIVPLSAYANSDSFNPNVCPSKDWMADEPVVVYAGVTGLLVSCAGNTIQIRTETFDYVYTHIIPSVGTCNGTVTINQKDPIGVLISPDDDPRISNLAQLDLQILDRTGRVTPVDPTPLIGSRIERSGYGQCQPLSQ